MDIVSISVNVLVLLLAITLHEFAHSWTSRQLGDFTAANYNRISLNPKNHIDPVGTIVLPILLILVHSPIILGWAKPVPVNPNQFKNSKIGMLFTSISGPAMNLILVIIFSILYKFLHKINFSIIVYFLQISVIINLFMLFFNLIPIPPLDGYNALINFLPYNITSKIKIMEPYGFLIILLFFYFGIIDLIIINPVQIIINLII